MFDMRGCGGLSAGFVMEWNTPSDIVERHMFPRQTKRTETGLGELASPMMAANDCTDATWCTPG